MSSFQAWVFHRTLPPKLVSNDSEFRQALADGWADTPAAFYVPPGEPVPEPAPAPPVARRGRRRDTT